VSLALFLALFVILAATRETVAPALTETPVHAVEAPIAEPPPPTHEPPPPPPVPPLRVSAKTYYVAYQENELAADRAYKGKRILMRHAVGSVQAGFTGGVYVIFGTSFERIQAIFRDDQKDALASLKRSQAISVNCEGAGLSLGTPVLSDCALE